MVIACCSLAYGYMRQPPKAGPSVNAPSVMDAAQSTRIRGNEPPFWTVVMSCNEERTAQCHCGELRVIASGEPERVYVCHCRACQRRTGAVVPTTQDKLSDRLSIIMEATVLSKLMAALRALMCLGCPIYYPRASTTLDKLSGLFLTIGRTNTRFSGTPTAPSPYSIYPGRRSLLCLRHFCSSNPRPDLPGHPESKTVTARATRRSFRSLAGSMPRRQRLGSPASARCKIPSSRFAKDSTSN